MGISEREVSLIGGGLIVDLFDGIIFEVDIDLIDVVVVDDVVVSLSLFLILLCDDMVGLNSVEVVVVVVGFFILLLFDEIEDLGMDVTLSVFLDKNNDLQLSFLAWCCFIPRWLFARVPHVQATPPTFWASSEDHFRSL